MCAPPPVTVPPAPARSRPRAGPLPGGGASRPPSRRGVGRGGAGGREGGGWEGGAPGSPAEGRTAFPSRAPLGLTGKPTSQARKATFLHLGQAQTVASNWDPRRRPGPSGTLSLSSFALPLSSPSRYRGVSAESSGSPGTWPRGSLYASRGGLASCSASRCWKSLGRTREGGGIAEGWGAGAWGGRKICGSNFEAPLQLAPACGRAGTNGPERTLQRSPCHGLAARWRREGERELRGGERGGEPGVPRCPTHRPTARGEPLERAGAEQSLGQAGGRRSRFLATPINLLGRAPSEGMRLGSPWREATPPQGCWAAAFSHSPKFLGWN